MNKNANNRFPSVRNNLPFQRKESKDMTMCLSAKDDFINVDSEKKLQTMATGQNDVAKKIQAKLRMRKPSGSDRQLKQTLKEMDSVS